MRYLFLFLPLNCLLGQLPQERALISLFDSCYPEKCVYYRRFPSYKMLSEKSKDIVELKEECINIWYYALDTNYYAGALFAYSYENTDNFLFIFNVKKEEYIEIGSALQSPTLEKVLYNPLDGSRIEVMLRCPNNMYFCEQRLPRYYFIFKRRFNHYMLNVYLYKKDTYSIAYMGGELTPFQPITEEVTFEYYIDLMEKVRNIPIDYSAPQLEWSKIRYLCK